MLDPVSSLVWSRDLQVHRGQPGLLVEKEQRVSEEETANQELMDSQVHRYIYACLSAVFI